MDVKLYYKEAGKGFPLILLHGNGENGGYFEHQIGYFQDKYRVIDAALDCGSRPGARSHLRSGSLRKICMILWMSRKLKRHIFWDFQTEEIQPLYLLLNIHDGSAG